MRTVLKIAGHELKLLFCSPVAWLLLIVFLYQFGDAFVGNLSGADAEILKYYPGYTSWLFSSNVFPLIDSKIYFYIPLMTMGLLSQELSTGNIKLLFSAPIKTSSIVLGKYFGIMGYWLIVIILFSLFAIPPYFLIQHLDLGVVLPGILAVFLLACTYSAIGLFMSCMTTYQIVAALGTLAVLAALNYIGGLWQGVPVLKDVVNFLHIAGHAENMNSGFVKSKDVLYFIIITLLFLGLAVFALEDSIHFRSRLSKAKRYVLFTVLMVGLGCLFSLRQLTLYFDTTAIKFNTISKSSQALLARIKGPVSVTAYANLMDNSAERSAGMQENRMKDFNFWEPYIRFLPQLELKYVNYYASADPGWTASAMDSTASRSAAQMGWYIEDFLTPKQIDQVIDLKPEGLTFVRTVEQGRKLRFLRVFSDPIHVPTEKEIITAFTGLMVDYPKIGFLTGHYERGIDDYEDRSYKAVVNEPKNRSALINQGFDVQQVSMKGKILDDIDALVIGEPLTGYTTEEQVKLKDYISKGGNLLVIGGPKSQDILNPVVEQLGVRFKKGQLVERNKDFSEDMVFTHAPLREGGDPYEFQFGRPVGMPASIGLEYSSNAGFKVEKALITDESTTWNTTTEIPMDTALIRYDSGKGDAHSELPVALSLTRNIGKKEQRIMVVGNGSFMSNENLNRDYLKQPVANFEFAVSIFKWFGHGKYPIQVAPLASPKDVELNYTKEDFAKFKLYYTWLLPVLVLLCGAIFLMRRRRK